MAETSIIQIKDYLNRITVDKPRIYMTQKFGLDLLIRHCDIRYKLLLYIIAKSALSDRDVQPFCPQFFRQAVSAESKGL